MEIFKGSITDKLKHNKFARKAPIAAAAFVVAACSGSANYPGENVLRHELETGQASQGRTIADFVVKGANDQYQNELNYNGGVNVRVSAVGDASHGFKETTVVTVAPLGKEIYGADEYTGKYFVDNGGAIAFECTQISDLIASSIRENYNNKICYIFRADKYLQKAE